MLSLSAIAIHIENASPIFSETSRTTFVDMLGDVGSVIADVAKTDQMLMAYAGNGNFVGVVEQGLRSSPGDMEAMIDPGMAGWRISMPCMRRTDCPCHRYGSGRW